MTWGTQDGWYSSGALKDFLAKLLKERLLKKELPPEITVACTTFIAKHKKKKSAALPQYAIGHIAGVKEKDIVVSLDFEIPSQMTITEALLSTMAAPPYFAPYGTYYPQLLLLLLLPAVLRRDD